MERIPASERTRERLKALMSGGSEAADSRSELARLAARLIIEEALEGEASDALERGYYARGAVSGRGYRNGYRTGRLKSAEGLIDYSAPQIAERTEPFRSRIRQILRGRTEELENLAVEMYARGLSTRDIEALFADESGGSLLSRTAVSEITERLWAEYEGWDRSEETWRRSCRLRAEFGIRARASSCPPASRSRSCIISSHAAASADARCHGPRAGGTRPSGSQAASGEGSGPVNPANTFRNVSAHSIRRSLSCSRPRCTSGTSRMRCATSHASMMAHMRTDPAPCLGLPSGSRACSQNVCHASTTRSSASSRANNSGTPAWAPCNLA
jgi:Transposase, Mutator family